MKGMQQVLGREYILLFERGSKILLRRYETPSLAALESRKATLWHKFSCSNNDFSGEGSYQQYVCGISSRFSILGPKANLMGSSPKTFSRNLFCKEPSPCQRSVSTRA
jgi:hypothetical protein